MRANNILPLLACAFMGYTAVACEDAVQGVAVDFIAEGTTFRPDSIELSTMPGDTLVRWGFSDGPHNIAFEDGATASGNRSSGVFERSYALVAAGVNRFRCTVHSSDFATGMVGMVVVN